MKVCFSSLSHQSCRDIKYWIAPEAIPSDTGRRQLPPKFTTFSSYLYPHINILARDLSEIDLYRDFHLSREKEPADSQGGKQQQGFEYCRQGACHRKSDPETDQDIGRLSAPSGRNKGQEKVASLASSAEGATWSCRSGDDQIFLFARPAFPLADRQRSTTPASSPVRPGG